ncbi:hypothetical protein LTR56_024558 [Elasticomyces elasticus]|nr:hypothetical protein LTR56_024558 [Elasticomyces elasticus]KAK3647400.1 hypothetical protein LTR22_013831 [Elasticomyces elasticus]KAK4917679.1 hypothetical protein LTR49_014501 [Elasticomyces elasticus]KAK5742720.1 hypothetical protein LTS12_024139 [Elasticomyces elasticus]
MSSLGNEKVESATKVEQLVEANLAEVKVVKGSEAYAEALLKEKPSLSSFVTWKLIGCLLIGCFCQTVNGFDGSVFGGLTANSRFLDYFHGTNDGEWAALNSAMYQIGSVCGLPFVGPSIDLYGRRAGMVTGALVIILGCILNGLTLHASNYHQATSMLQGGRFLLGFGVSILSSAGPIYVVETAHPAWRGIITAYCNTFWFVGSILASGAVRGGLNLTGNASWQLPLWLQIVFPGLIVLFVAFIPESPRWLFVNNKRTNAVQTLTKWHGNGNPESPWVKLQLAEYEDFLNTNGTDKTVWDYRALFKTRASRYRLACNCIFSIFAQWAGNGVLTYFLPAVLDTAGYHEDVTQANINLAYACFQFACALFGAAFVDKAGRRPMMLGSMAGCCIMWIGVTASTALFSQSDDTNGAAAKATVACIFLFGAVFSVGITPLQALYPVEVLSFEMRAKGMGFSSLSVAIGGLLNQFAWPISLAKIGWHTYIIFIVWDAIQWGVWYTIMPETKNRTLEELDKIFEARRPVKESLIPHKLAVDKEGTVLASEIA